MWIEFHIFILVVTQTNALDWVHESDVGKHVRMTLAVTDTFLANPTSYV